MSGFISPPFFSKEQYGAMQQGFRREERGLKKDKRAIDQALMRASMP